MVYIKFVEVLVYCTTMNYDEAVCVYWRGNYRYTLAVKVHFGVKHKLVGQMNIAIFLL